MGEGNGEEKMGSGRREGILTYKTLSLKMRNFFKKHKSLWMGHTFYMWLNHLLCALELVGIHFMTMKQALGLAKIISQCRYKNQVGYCQVHSTK